MLLRQRLPGKLCPRCSGLYVFLRSMGPNPATLKLMEPNGKVRQALIGNFVPYRSSADVED